MTLLGFLRGSMVEARAGKKMRFPEGLMTWREWLSKYATSVKAHPSTYDDFYNRRAYNRDSEEHEKSIRRKMSEQPIIYSAYQADTAQTASIDLGARRVVRGLDDDEDDDTSEPYPTLVAVPIVWPGSSFGTLHFPLAEGDSVAVFFPEVSIDRWLATGEAEDPGIARREVGDDPRGRERDRGLALVRLEAPSAQAKPVREAEGEVMARPNKSGVPLPRYRTYPRRAVCRLQHGDRQISR